MKIILQFIAFFLISYTAQSQNIGVISTVNLGGNGTDQVFKSLSSSDGKIIIVGSTTSTNNHFSSNHGGQDVFILKVDTLGIILWSKMIGGTNDDYVVDFGLESNGEIKILCNSNSTNGDFLVVNNEFVTYTSDGGYRLITVSSDGSTILNSAGQSKTTNMGWKPEGMSFVKISNLDKILSRSGFLNCGGGNQYHCIAGLGNFGGQLVNGSQYCGSTNFNKIIKLANDDILALGTTSGIKNNDPNTCSDDDIIIYRESSNGTFIWNRKIGGSGDDFSVDVKEINNEIYILANTFSNNGDVESNAAGGGDIWLVKLNSNGIIVRDTTFGNSSKNLANTLKISSNGTLLVGGFTSGFQSQFIEFDLNFNIIKQFSTYNNNNGNSVKDLVELQSKYYLLTEQGQAGPNSNNSFSGPTVGGDIFLVKLGPCIPPTVSVTPNTQTISLGQTATYNATFSGTPPFNLTLPNGAIVSGIMSNSYTFSWTPNSIGNFTYTPSVTTCGLVLANQIAITVTAASNISLNPLSTTKYCIGQGIPVVFSSSLAVNTVFTIQLKKGNSVIQTVNTTSKNYNLFINYSSSMLYGTDYYVKVSAGLDSAKTAFLTIGNLVYNSNNRFEDINNNIVTGISICPNTNRFLSIKLHKLDNTLIYDPVIFTWSNNNVPLDTNETGSYTLNSGGNYSVKAVLGGCTLTQSIYVNQSSSFSNYISNIGYETICNGQSRKLTSNYVSNTAQFQWYLNNQPISNSNIYQINATETGTYRVSVVETGCNIFPGNFKLVFSEALNPIVSLYNNDSTICNGSYKSMSMSTFQFATNEFQYQWYKDGLAIANATLPSYGTNLPGKYYLLIKQGTCESRSKIINLISSTKAQKPNFSMMQYTQACAGASIRIQEIRNSPYGNYLETINNYGFWYKDGVKLQNYTTNYYDATQTGSYKLVMSEGTTCSVESDPVNIIIGQMFKPKIASNDDRTVVCGNNLNLRLQNLNIGHNNGFTYQWKLNGNNISAETSQYINPYASGGAYSLVVTYGACQMESDPINVLTNTSNLTLVTNNSELTCSNALTKINIKEMSQYGYYNSTNWFRNGILIPNEKEPYLYTSLPGIYTATQNAVCIGTSAPLEIKTSSPAGFYAEAFDTVPSGQNVSLSITSCSGTVKWYNEETPGTLISIGNSYTTPSLTQNTNYWVTCTIDFCESPRKQILVHVSNPCPSEIIHNGAVTAQEYKTSGRIVSNVNLSNGIKYNAKTHIELSPGFQVGDNEVFEAVIGGCDN